MWIKNRYGNLWFLKIVCIMYMLMMMMMISIFISDPSIDMHDLYGFSFFFLFLFIFFVMIGFQAISSRFFVWSCFRSSSSKIIIYTIFDIHLLVHQKKKKNTNMNVFLIPFESRLEGCLFDRDYHFTYITITTTTTTSKHDYYTLSTWEFFFISFTHITTTTFQL